MRVSLARGTIVNRISSVISARLRRRSDLARGDAHLARRGQLFGMLIRHTACFSLPSKLDHAVAVVLAPLVAALVPVVGFAPRAAPACLVVGAVRLAVIARAADHEPAPAPPALDQPRVRSHPLPAASAENFVRLGGSCDDAHAPLVRGSGRNPGPLPFCRRSPGQWIYRAGD